MAEPPACLRQRTSRRVGWLLSGLLLAGCGSGPAAPASHLAASRARPALTRTVAPGLVVRITSTVPTDTTVGDQMDQELVFALERNGQVIFQDTATDGLAFTGYSELVSYRLYPLWVPAGPGAGELLVAYSGRPGRDKVRRFRLAGQHVTGIDTLVAFDGPPCNLDQDGWLEYSGFAGYNEDWDDAQGHHQVYNPLLCYEVRPTGLVLDTALTISRNRALYGKFYGYHYSEQPVIITKRPGK